MEMGERIKNARIAANITQAELAKRLGVAYQNIGQWESGKRNPKLDTLQKIAKALNVPVARLYGLEDRETPELQEALDEAIKESADDQGNIDMYSFQENLRIRNAAIKYRDLIILRKKTDELYLEVLKGKTDDDLRSILCDDFDTLNRVGKIEAVKRVSELVSLRRFSSVFGSDDDS